MRYVIINKVEVEFVMSCRIINTSEHARQKHSHRQKRDQEHKMLLYRLRQQKNKRGKCKHKRTYVCHGQRILKVPVVKAHVTVNRDRHHNVRYKHRTDQKRICEIYILHIFHRKNAEYV